VDEHVCWVSVEMENGQVFGCEKGWANRRPKFIHRQVRARCGQTTVSLCLHGMVLGVSYWIVLFVLGTATGQAVLIGWPCCQRLRVRDPSGPPESAQEDWQGTFDQVSRLPSGQAGIGMERFGCSEDGESGQAAIDFSGFTALPCVL